MEFLFLHYKAKSKNSTPRIFHHYPWITRLWHL